MGPELRPQAKAFPEGRSRSMGRATHVGVNCPASAVRCRVVNHFLWGVRSSVPLCDLARMATLVRRLKLILFVHAVLAFAPLGMRLVSPVTAW